MSEFANSEIKQGIVDQNTSLALLSGFIRRYHDGLRNNLRFQERIASLDCEYSGNYARAAEQTRLALRAEAPVAFSVEPSNLAASVHVIKVNPDSGEEIPGSSVQIGLAGGLAKDGFASRDFTDQDLSFAVERVRAQEQAGLYYGLDGGSVFI